MEGKHFLHISKKFFLFGICFLIGIFFGSILNFKWDNVFNFVFLFCVVVFIFICSNNKKSFLVLTSFLIIIIGVLYVKIFQPRIDNLSIQSVLNKNIEFIGKIKYEPDNKIENQNLIVEVQKINDIQVKQNQFGKILIKTDRFPKYEYGDLLLIECILKEPKSFNDFDYKLYLARQGIFLVCDFPKKINLIVGELKNEHKNSLIWFLFFIKQKVSLKIHSLLHEPEASFLAGILIGERRGFEKELLDYFNKSGITHIIAVSGYNIAILVSSIQSICFFWLIKKRNIFVIIFFVLSFFVFFSGFGASVVRASIMGVLVLISKNVNRFANIKNIILGSALIMVLFNPNVLVFDIGFQLSFLSTIGLIYGTHYIENFFWWCNNTFGVKNSLVSTLASTIFTLPIIIFYFKQFATHSILVNVLVLPVIPFAMFFGFIALFVSFFNLFLGQVLAYPVFIILSYVIKIAQFFS